MYLSHPALYTHVKQKHAGTAPEGTTEPASRFGKTQGRPTRSVQRTTHIDNSDDDDFYEKYEFAGGPADALEASPDSSELKDSISHLDPDTLSSESPCKHVLAAYVLDVATKVKQSSLKLIAEFVDALMTCLNMKGYSLPGESGESEGGFCANRPAKHIPDIANYFIMDYLEGRRGAPERAVAVALMLHLCHWLNKQHFTNRKLSLIDQDKTSSS